MRSSIFCFALALVPALLAPLASHAAPLYSVSALPENFYANDINNSGQIAGYLVADDGASHAALYSGGGVTDLGLSGAGFSTANAINNAGLITGTIFSASGGYHAFVVDHGSVLDLGPNTNAFGINASGAVVGQAAGSAGSSTAFVYRDGMLTDLGTLAAGTTSVGYDINDQGKIVGTSDINAELKTSFHPFLYKHGALQDLGTLANFENNSAQAINNAGRIAGYSEAQDGSLHAFVHEHGLLTDLGSFGGLFLDVGGINEQGAFVGSASTAGADIGFIYLDGALVDLNTLLDPALGWHIDGASGINDAGQIAAHGCRDFVCSAVRLDLASAVPEPAGALLLVPGLMMLVGTRRRALRKPRVSILGLASGTAAA